MHPVKVNIDIITTKSQNRTICIRSCKCRLTCRCRVLEQLHRVAGRLIHSAAKVAYLNDVAVGRRGREGQRIALRGVCLRQTRLLHDVTDDDEDRLAGHDVLRQREGCRATVAGKGLEGDVTYVWIYADIGQL